MALASMRVAVPAESVVHENETRITSFRISNKRRSSLTLNIKIKTHPRHVYYIYNP